MHIQKNIHYLLDVCTDFTADEQELIRHAYNETHQAFAEYTRENGEPLLHHAVTVAHMAVQDVGLTASSVIAVLLHEAIQQTEKKPCEETKEKVVGLHKSEEQRVLKQYGSEVANIVTGLNKIASIDIKQTSLQAENFRKLIVSYSIDPRVTIIKLIDRLEVMRSLDFFPKSKQLKKATETLLLYAPLAHQLGLYNIKSELEDLSLKYTEPEAFRLINNKFKSTIDEREALFEKIVDPIDKALQKELLNYEIKGRTKSIYSIWKKMQAQEINFEKVYDIFACRIILDTPPIKEEEQAACWKVYSIVEKIYETDLHRLRDWISNPKKSGYESLHTTVNTKEGTVLEVQIRTARMDEAAERGAAAHWKYKGVENLGSMQQWLDQVRCLLEAPDENADSYTTTIKLDEIIVFTPSGDLRRLPAGASVLDFAFNLHTNVGLQFAGAKVNGHIVPIKEKLRTGDTIEILTSKKQQPTIDWLNYVVSSKARSKIKQKLREEETKRAQEGKELLERRLKNWKLSLTDEMLHKFLKHYKLKSITELYAGLASEKIDITQLKELLTAIPDEQVYSKQEVVQPATQSVSPNDVLMIDEKLNSTNYKLSKCCNPIFGDEVFGFITISDGIKIHRLTCPNASRLLDKYPYRILKAKWIKASTINAFQVTLRITGYSEPGISSHITETINKLNSALRSFNFTGDGGLFNGRVKVLVNDNKHLEGLLYHLRKIKGVQKVARVL